MDDTTAKGRELQPLAGVAGNNEININTNFMMNGVHKHLSNRQNAEDLD